MARMAPECDWNIALDHAPQCTNLGAGQHTQASNPAVGLYTVTFIKYVPPPPPKRELFAALTTASISRSVISPLKRDTCIVFNKICLSNF